MIPYNIYTTIITYGAPTAVPPVMASPISVIADFTLCNMPAPRTQTVFFLSQPCEREQVRGTPATCPRNWKRPQGVPALVPVLCTKLVLLCPQAGAAQQWHRWTLSSNRTAKIFTLQESSKLFSLQKSGQRVGGGGSEREREWARD